MASPEEQALVQQLTKLDKETEEMKQLALSVEEMESKLQVNKIARTKLKKELLNLGYKL